jgi:hypothetical protein
VREMRVCDSSEMWRFMSPLSSMSFSRPPSRCAVEILFPLSTLEWMFIQKIPKCLLRSNQISFLRIWRKYACFGNLLSQQI